VVEDLGSRNTTLLNGRPLATPARVGVGDLVKLSETVISIEGFDPSAQGARPANGLVGTIVLRSARLIAAAGRVGRPASSYEVHRALAAAHPRGTLGWSRPHFASG
jgi:hypothetical protein